MPYFTLIIMFYHVKIAYYHVSSPNSSSLVSASSVLPHNFKVIKIDIVLADNFPLLYVMIPRPDEKRRSDGELEAQTERNHFANIASRGYFSDPILHHHCRASR